MRSLVLLSLLGLAASSLSLSAQVIANDFASDYTLHNLGSVAGLPGSYGGITFKNDDPDVILIGGNANSFNGAIYSVNVIRGEGGHITGFSGAATLFAPAAYIDGGLTYGPGGVLFFTTYSDNRIGQILPGETTPRYTSVSANGIQSSVGSLMFVPEGFPGAGGLKVLSYNGGTAYDLPYSLGEDGYYTFGTAMLTGSGMPGPEGMVYVSGENAGFDGPSVLVSAYSAGAVYAYAVDAAGNPVIDSRRDFVLGLSGAEGAVIDPITGDFLFSTYGGGDKVIRVSGFVPVPEPQTYAAIAGAVLGVCVFFRRRRIGK